MCEPGPVGGPVELGKALGGALAVLSSARGQAAAAFRDQESWLKMSIRNSAASGRFSTDRTIADYNREIWKLPRVPVEERGD